jgi:hypothetical protein
MTRKIIDEDESDYTFLISTYWAGDHEGVQITLIGSTAMQGYVTLTREKALELFKITVEKIENQIEHDKVNPPFWQVLSKRLNQ